MSEGDDPADDYRRNLLVQQAEEIIEEDTGWIELAQQLDVNRYQKDDSHPPNHSTSKPFCRMFLAFLWANVEDIKLSCIPDELQDRPELARAFGFDPTDLPEKSTFKPSRLGERFEDLKPAVDIAAKGIRNIAAKRGAPIGHPLPDASSASDEDEDEEGPSERTIDRMIRSTKNDVLKELRDAIIPSLSLPRSDDAVYDDKTILVLLAIAALKQKAANGAGKSLGDLLNPDPDIKTDPFFEDGPTGETALDPIKDLSVETIEELMNFALKKCYTRAKPKLRDLDDWNTNVMLALDITYVAYWGKTEGLEWLQGAPEDKEYRWCHMFATASIVGQNTHYTVAVIPLGSYEHTDQEAYPESKQKSYRIGDVARQLIQRASEFVDIRMVYADRAFHAADVLDTLENHDLKYVIPAKKDDRITRICTRFDHLKNGFEDVEDDPEMYVQQNYAIRGPVKHGRSNERVETNLVVLAPDEDDDTHEDGSPQPFITNSEVDDQIAPDRRKTAKKIERYSNRGAIENTYKKIKECAAWTTSKEFNIRWFHFAFGCVIYNMWLLVDFLVQDRIGVIETRSKPRIQLSRFLDWTDEVLVTLI